MARVYLCVDLSATGSLLPLLSSLKARRLLRVGELRFQL